MGVAVGAVVGVESGIGVAVGRLVAVGDRVGVAVGTSVAVSTGVGTVVGSVVEISSEVGVEADVQPANTIKAIRMKPVYSVVTRITLTGSLVSHYWFADSS